MKTENWLLCHVHAYGYFGGVPRLLIPDNLKTGVTKTTKLGTIPVLYADTIRTNLRSQHVLEKVGFALVREDEDFKYYRIERS